ncbi:MAG: hypothetical protein EBV34_16170, partial [Betaproteobacteria bacterium]|nr:hypothetical protein [Betaproteobacteria bacterium]
MASGSYYAGEWREDNFHGHGTFFLANGTKYVGEFCGSYFCGKGIEYSHTGVLLRAGYWSQDRFVASEALDENRFPFERDLLIMQLQLEGDDGSSGWKTRVDRTVRSVLQQWLSPASVLDEVPAPSYPASLSLKQESWET